ncbi:MAG TPA: helix-turn-helix domain-containing protein [Candidatus Acidoferrales bacterium]|nr:helix-turn-helix domain-containing protein [Candidatus Acidoferrales bacterium]
MTKTSRKTADFMRKILTEDEVRLMTRRLRKVAGPLLRELAGRYGIDFEGSVRFGAVAHRVREAREARGMDLKAAAKALRVPQYRLRYIEQCNLKHLRGSDLRAYIDFLGLNQWFARWRKANLKLAARLARDTNSKVK